MSELDAKRRCCGNRVMTFARPFQHHYCPGCGKTYAAKPPHHEITGLESFRQAGGAEPRPGAPDFHPLRTTVKHRTGDRYT